MRNLGVYILTLFISVTLSCKTATAKVFNAQSTFLPNGMQVVLIENNRAPVVSHMVWYKVGRADELSGHSGLAHFFEHLMFKGTKTVPAGEFSKIVKSLGGNDNAFTSQDYTAYFQSVPVEHLDTVMKMEADRMTNLNVSDENVLTERDVIIEERKQRVENNPSAILGEEIDSTLYANHPYRVPVIGFMSEIEGLTPNDAREFYKTWYAPNNAILVVSGNISMDDLMPLAEKRYGVIPPITLPETIYPKPAPIKARHEISYKDARVGTPTLKIIYRAPHKSEALSVLADAFGGNTTSQLYKSLVLDQKLAVQAGAYYSSVSKGPSEFTVYAVPAPGVDLKTLELSLVGEIDTLLASGINHDDIERAKQRMIDATIFERDSLMGPAMIVGRALTSGFTLDEIENWPDTVKAVTSEDIEKIRDTVLNGANQPIIAKLLPAEGL
jgi:zinc protease